ncbi:hypothetical protein B0H67DRAFT_272512 [Lasiosphaeris hirsuta]|uniref:Uncharacterized protein n=1 Tax=Lasiosphaeris hirsuta TaxID=260670 RepID=A0AA40A8H5_9PEZI|nr:hypothetical protein B0H67DRAFT_272512 [Lasiosphaeris hirsuta]
MDPHLSRSTAWGGGLCRSQTRKLLIAYSGRGLACSAALPSIRRAPPRTEHHPPGLVVWPVPIADIRDSRCQQFLDCHTWNDTHGLMLSMLEILGTPPGPHHGNTTAPLVQCPFTILAFEAAIAVNHIAFLARKRSVDVLDMRVVSGDDLPPSCRTPRSVLGWAVLFPVAPCSSLLLAASQTRLPMARWQALPPARGLREAGCVDCVAWPALGGYLRHQARDAPRRPE